MFIMDDPEKILDINPRTGEARAKELWEILSDEAIIQGLDPCYRSAEECVQYIKKNKLEIAKKLVKYHRDDR